MEIGGIHSSPKGKNSNTLKLLNAALDAASEEGADIETLDVAKMRINYCNSCNTCHDTGVCAIKDDYELVFLS